MQQETKTSKKSGDQEIENDGSFDGFGNWDAINISGSKMADAAMEAMNSSWNVNTFEERLGDADDWQEEEQHKATRLQDIGMALVDDSCGKRKDEQEKKQWPYESSPCKLFGGKNTRNNTTAEAVNKELFETNFAEKEFDTFQDMEELLDHEPQVDALFEKAPTMRRAKQTTRTTKTTTRKSRQRSRSSSPSMELRFRRSTSKSRSRTRSKSRTRSRSKSRSRTRSQSQTRSRSKSQTRARSKSRTRARSKSPSPTNYRVVRKTITRLKSSDNMEFGHVEARKAYRKKPDKATKPAVKTRPRISRAMSNDNVEPPEQTTNETSPRDRTNVYGGTGGRRRGRKKQEPLIDDSTTNESEEFLSPQQPACPSIMEKFKDKSSICEDDLCDVANRRLLHCIVYKTTLGVDFPELRDAVEQELNESPGNGSLRRPTPPLYIEPAN